MPLSLRRKASARLAAAQCLYRVHITGEETSAAALLEDYLAQWRDDRESNARVLSRDPEPDRSFLRKLLFGAMEKKPEIERIIAGALNDKWTLPRMSPLLIAILTCAVFAMKYQAALSPSILIDQYVTLTGRFFEPAEIGFVNGLLDALAKGEAGAPGGAGAKAGE